MKHSISRLMGLLLTGALLTSAGTAQAIDFKASGSWMFGLAGGDASLVKKVNGKKTHNTDQFEAGQRIHFQLDAVASEFLSGTVMFEIGDTVWGQNATGGALGADGKIIELKRAYLDWTVPETSLKFRMGIQNVTLPNAAGGSGVLNADVAGIVGTMQFNENIGLTALWIRPANDNFAGRTSGTKTVNSNYLDNIDLFSLALPMTFDGITVTPWVMYGFMGKNALEGYNHGLYPNSGTDTNPFFGRYGGNSPAGSWATSDGKLDLQLYSYYPGFNVSSRVRNNGQPWTSMFWGGIPIKLKTWDPLNIEFDFNYAYVQGNGGYSIMKRGDKNNLTSASTMRQGWLAKLLIEYKFDWGTPGIFGWYSSGDDGDMSNGSKRMPSIGPCNQFSAFMGDGTLDWSPYTPVGGMNGMFGKALGFAGTWGVGLQVKDLSSFTEDLKHTIRAIYWGGTNSPSMVKYMSSRDSWNKGYWADGPYMTTNDGLVELNFTSDYKIYENLKLNFEASYLINCIDSATWDRSWMKNADGSRQSIDKQDAWKLQLTFIYQF